MSRKQEEISRKILAYLRQNPDAEDTLEGIVEWWLESERVNQAVDEVAEALKGMVRRGVIEKICLDGKGSLYRINRIRH